MSSTQAQDAQGSRPLSTLPTAPKPDTQTFTVWHALRNVTCGLPYQLTLEQFATRVHATHNGAVCAKEDGPVWSPVINVDGYRRNKPFLEICVVTTYIVWSCDTCPERL